MANMSLLFLIKSYLDARQKFFNLVAYFQTLGHHRTLDDVAKMQYPGSLNSPDYETVINNLSLYDYNPERQPPRASDPYRTAKLHSHERDSTKMALRSSVDNHLFVIDQELKARERNKISRFLDPNY